MVAANSSIGPLVPQSETRMHSEATMAAHHRMGVLSERFRSVRQFTEKLCEPLAAEDCIVQSMPDASPIRWHLAHTTWFFETFVLKRIPEYRPFHEDFEYLFNSYYNTVGKQFPRHHRGLITRPSVDDVWTYRKHVDQQILQLCEQQLESQLDEDIAKIFEIGLQHEQQHQELMLTDIKHAFSCNPLCPVYHDVGTRIDQARANKPMGWHEFDECVYEFGHADDSFAFDNESPRHRSFIHDFKIGDRLITSREFLEFMEDDGYRRPELWLSLGWSTVQEESWSAPLYWSQRDGEWHEFTLSGERPVTLSSPVCHVSYFEADAFARWSGKRLPTEFEWELASAESNVSGNFADTSASFHPTAVVENNDPHDSIEQLFGDVWEWTASQYSPYPGFVAEPGALGEYNGKFMCNQFVLRGGSCATSQTHIRPTYRNFFPPQSRWQFSGIRLAE